MFPCDILSALSEQKNCHQACRGVLLLSLPTYKDKRIPVSVLGGWEHLRQRFGLVVVKKWVWSYQNSFELKAICLVCDQFCLWPRAMYDRWWETTQWQCFMWTYREKPHIVFIVTGTCPLMLTQLPGLMNSVEHQLWSYFFSFFSSPCIHVWSQKRYNRFCRECQACFPPLKAWEFMISEGYCDLRVPDLCGLLHASILT